MNKLWKILAPVLIIPAVCVWLLLVVWELPSVLREDYLERRKGS